MRLFCFGVLFALAACSGSTPTDVLGESDGGRDAAPEASSAPDADASLDTSPGDAGTDADADAADACVPPPVTSDPMGRRCWVVAACPTCAGGVLYRCHTDAGRAQPSSRETLDGKLIGDCRLIAEAATTADYCCSPACVFNRNSPVESLPDSQCYATDPIAVSCATKPDGTLAVPRPPNCIAQGSGNPVPGQPMALCCGR